MCLRKVSKSISNINATLVDVKIVFPRKQNTDSLTCVSLGNVGDGNATSMIVRLSLNNGKLNKGGTKLFIKFNPLYTFK